MANSTYELRTLTAGLDAKFDNDSGTLVVYVGEAEPGTATTAGKWRIYKMKYSGNYPIQRRYADGVSTFTKVWDDRASYTYLDD
jgi:hypothetical protein